ncbi:MAG TPA: hypothetical protein VFE20_02135 [Thermoleophilia bacterium]|nr:hypothetical protein [Thermoleophilia bacterium]
MGDDPREQTNDPRLDESAWRVFGRRFPRRWSLYARVAAGALLLLFLGWWFTRDVTYVSNVKVAGLNTVDEAYAEPLRSLASDFARLVNHLADLGYGWQAGGLPTLRAGDALTTGDPVGLVALGSLEVKRGNASMMEGATAEELGAYLVTLGWAVGPEPALDGAEKDFGPLRGVIRLEERPEGRERLRIEVAPY